MIVGRQTGLGRGLGAIIPPKSTTPSYPSSSFGNAPAVDAPTPQIEERPRPNTSQIHQLPIDQIDPNPHQPREHFDHADLEDLVTSIRLHGVMQPIVVTPKADGRYELIAGERRLRASKIAERDTIPAIVRTATEQQKFELALIENIQRANLNAIEEARAYLRLQNEFNLTQDEIGQRVGKSRPQVGNIIRLLQLPDEIQQAVIQGKISTSNARTLLSLPTEAQRMEMFQAMLDGNFTVRQTEARVMHPRSNRVVSLDPNLVHLENELRNALGVKVKIKRDPRGEGEIRITFLNDEDFQNIKKKIVGA